MKLLLEWADPHRLCRRPRNGPFLVWGPSLLMHDRTPSAPTDLEAIA